MTHAVQTLETGILQLKRLPCTTRRICSPRSVRRDKEDPNSVFMHKSVPVPRASPTSRRDAAQPFVPADPLPQAPPSRSRPSWS